MNINLSIVLICAAFALILVWLQQQRLLAADTLMGILAHAALSMGMVAISFLSAQNFDLHSYLFGDILTVSTQDLLWIYGGGSVVIGTLIAIWPQLILLTIHEDLAKAEGINNTMMHLLLVLLMTIVVSVSIRLVGILLITSLLIIPAASARQWVKQPETMAILSAMIGVCSVVLGIGASAKFDIPSGPAIVVAAAFIFAVFSPLASITRRKSNSF
jgi:zinc transport system permease protein